MDIFTSYLLKSAVWLSGFAIIFLLFLRKERFFMLKRAYLLTGIIISIVFPLITVHYKVELPQPEVLPLTQSSFDSINPSGSAIIKNQFPFKYIITGIYMAGIIFLLIRSVYQLRRLFRSIKGSKINDLGNAKLIRSSEFKSSFSFFSYVFVNPHADENEIKEIMNHELVHVTQKHWLDLILGELMRILQWVNPFVWVYYAFIRLNHEYIADQVALKRSSDPAVYKAALLNQVFREPVFSLANSFNYSITKTRFDMMKNIITSPYRKLKILLIVPVIALLFYAFSEPEVSYVPSSNHFAGESISPGTVRQATVLPDMIPLPQKQLIAKGIITDKDGKPLADAVVRSSGIQNDTFFDEADENGRFEIVVGNKDATLIFSARGYKQTDLKPDFSKEMKVVLERNPEMPMQGNQGGNGSLRIYIDGVLSQETDLMKVREDLGYNWGILRNLRGKEATDKYGAGVTEVYEIITRKKAIDQGLNPPFPRLKPDDYPTFQGQTYSSFNGWVAEKVSYPAQAKAENVQGWVSVRLTIGKDGAITGVEPASYPSRLLLDEVIKVINSAPKFDPPKNPAVDEPFTTEVTVRFRLPETVSGTDIPFVVVEQMPRYPGGDAELLKFIAENVRYPEEAKKNGIYGRVILRFVVTTEGNAENVTVMRGVDPLLDAEAVRVVNMLKGFEPGMQSGKLVNVWYMVPITFTLPGTSPTN